MHWDEIEMHINIYAQIQKIYIEYAGHAIASIDWFYLYIKRDVCVKPVSSFLKIIPE